MAGIEETVIGLVGRPFAWGGRGPDSYDCWGVVRVVAEAMGRVLPDYEEANNVESVVRHIERETKTEKWRKVDIPEPGDVVLLSTVPNLFHHAGILTEWGVLHAVPKRGVLISREPDLRAAGYVHMEAYRWVL